MSIFWNGKNFFPASVIQLFSTYAKLSVDSDCAENILDFKKYGRSLGLKEKFI